MGLPMAMGNISGLMAVRTKAISSMESDMAMGSGMTRRRLKSIQDVIGWIRRKALGFTSGLESRLIKGNSEKITGKGLVACTK